MNADLEIDFEKAKELARDGHNVFVFINNFGELELVKEVLGSANRVRDLDFGEARQIIFKEGEKAEIEKSAREFQDAVIVCPHGRTSLKFVTALSEMGIRAYSLKGGIEGLRSRA